MTASTRTRVKLGRAFVGIVSLLILHCPTDSQSAAEGRSTCNDTALPLEGLGTEAQQRRLLFDQAAACVLKRKPRQAIALLSALIKTDPKDAAAYLNRGSVQASIGEIGLAISDYNIALRLEPGAAEAWYDRGTTLMRFQLHGRAVADLTEAIRLRPNLALAYCNRGVGNFNLGRYEEALADYTKGIELDPRRMRSCYFNRGNYYLMIGEYQKAVEDLSRALEQKSSHAIALSRRGQAYEGLGKEDRALEDFRAALQLDSKLDSALEGIARLTQEQNRPVGGNYRKN